MSTSIPCEAGYSNGVRYFTCGWPDCAKIFTRKSDLIRHVRIHTNERPYACGEPGCGKRFIQQSALTVHRRTHSGERPHACEVEGCDRAFSDSSSLSRHRRVHTGDRPYKCLTCDKAFCRKATLNKHIRARRHRGPPSSNSSVNSSGSNSSSNAIDNSNPLYGSNSSIVNSLIWQTYRGLGDAGILSPSTSSDFSSLHSPLSSPHLTDDGSLPSTPCWQEPTKFNGNNGHQITPAFPSFLLQDASMPTFYGEVELERNVIEEETASMASSFLDQDTPTPTCYGADEMERNVIEKERASMASSFLDQDTSMPTCYGADERIRSNKEEGRTAMANKHQSALNCEFCYIPPSLDSGIFSTPFELLVDGPQNTTFKTRT